MKTRKLGLNFGLITILCNTTAIAAAALFSAVTTAGVLPQVPPGCPTNCPPAPPPPPYTNVSTCACITTGEFELAAQQKASSLHAAGTYLISSTSVASTAYIFITGTLSGGKWTTTSTTPIDFAGDVLTGQSESALEIIYAASDQTLFGANRGNPMAVNEPDSYASSFIGSEESEVVPGIGAALLSMKINQNAYAPGTVITVCFSDGSRALYIKQSAYSTYQWLWTGVAFNKVGQQINRSGGLVSIAKAGTGTGSVTASGFGVGANWTWTAVGDVEFAAISVTPTGTGYVDLPGFTGGGGSIHQLATNSD